MSSDDHMLADELHACVIDLARIHNIMDAMLRQLGTSSTPHTALEPSNVRITSTDSVIVRLPKRSVNPTWAAPETLKDGALEFRSNIYSIGRMLEAMLGARPDLPARARSLVAACTNPKMQERPDSFATVRAELQRIGLSMFRPSVGMWYRRFEPQDDRERTLVELMRKTPGDEGTRIVYADWLEENSHADRAAFMRQQATDSSRERISWRAIVSRAPIVGCRDGECPREWQRLESIAGIDNIRACQRCEKPITYCTSLEVAQDEGLVHLPIAIDAVLSHTDAVTAFERGHNAMPRATYMPRYQPPPPPPPATDDTEVPGEPGALARFFGWLRKQ
jgi:uncharacterized protein (TIGR02996 family)